MRNSHPHNLKRISLELGGKSANIIMDDADIDFAIEQAHFSLFFNAGQCCCAGSRAFVHEKIYDQFVERAAQHASGLRLGGQFTEGVQQGPQIDRTQMEKILGYVESGKKKVLSYSLEEPDSAIRDSTSSPPSSLVSPTR